MGVFSASSSKQPGQQPEPEQSLKLSRQSNFLKLTVLMLLVYGGLAVFYNTPALSTARLNKEILVWPVTLVLIWAYWQGAKTQAQNSIPTQWVIGSGILLAILAVLVPPFHSTDMFGYVNRGWQQAYYHLNPYVYTVDAISGWQQDPMITDHWVSNPSPYGFLYLLIAKGLCLLGNGQKALTLLVFKLGNLVMHLLTAALIGIGAKRMNDSPNSPLAGKLHPSLALYLYLWNPIVLINTLANGHNDVYMGFFVTLSAFFAMTGGWLWILPALMAATLIKYGAAVIFPVAGLFLIRQRAWTALILGTVLAMAVFGITGIPYLPDWQHFHLKEINHNAFVSHGSIHSVILSGFKTLAKEVFPAWYPYKEAARDTLKNILLGLYSLFYMGLLWKRLRQAEYRPNHFVQDALLVMGILVCFISPKFYPWYMNMFLPLTLFLPEGNWLRRWLLIVSAGQLFAITFIGQAHLLNFIIMTGIPTALAYWQHRRSNGSTPAPEPQRLEPTALVGTAVS